jgi:hypothetical protein
MIPSHNRYSMPVTRSRNGFYDLGTLDQTNTTRFLFGDEDASGETMASHTLVTNTDDAFPTLRRRSNIVSASASHSLAPITVLQLLRMAYLLI